VPDSFIVFSAHYDHLGIMGTEAIFTGANDNASGCAMMLSLAKHYAAHPAKYSMAFIGWGGEELGLLGSFNYVEHPVFPLGKIKFMVNVDIMGTGDDGITVVNGTGYKPRFDSMVVINKKLNLLKEVKIRNNAANSDHYPFVEKGVPAFFIYTLGGIKAYHDIYDKRETLPMTKFKEVYILLTEFVKTF
jgi:Zn-dependent M28 family amino/carboxypeptidase